MSFDQHRNNLLDAARAFTADESKHVELALCKAAADYATARLALAAGEKVRVEPVGNPDESVLPFGKSKNMPLSKAKRDDLQWVLGVVRKSIDDPDKARWVDSNVALAEAIEAELSKRGAL